MADNAVDILDTSALNALDVMMIVLNAGFVSGTRRVRQVDPADEADRREILHDQMNGLYRNRWQGDAHGLKNGFCVRVRMVMQVVENCDALRCRAQSLALRTCGH